MMNILRAVNSNKLLVWCNRRIVVCGAVVFCLLLANPASALVKFEFEQKYFYEPGQPVLDHCIVEKDGVYHLFYLRGNPALSIGHATTTDFIEWTLETPVLEPGTWDTKLWAPYIYTVPGQGWYMYYTGVNGSLAQQSGLAFSTNLIDWFKIPWPVYTPDPAWAYWFEDKFSPGRDPHVIEYNGKYYMFVTALTNTLYGAVGCAESEDLLTWTDVGPMYVHENWHVLESVFVKYRNGKFHMFFTEEAVYGTSHMCSDSLFSGWDIDTRYIIDQGHAPNIFELDSGVEIFSRHAVYNDNYGGMMYTLRFDTLTWFGDLPAPYKPWALSKDWNLVWGNAFSYQPTFLNNPAARGEDVDDTFVGNGWLGTYERYTGPLGFGTPGGFQGDGRTGILRSKTFMVTGASMNLLVGGGNDIDQLYVALVDVHTSTVLYKETGKDTDEMDRRYWDLKPHLGKTVYIEIADLSADVFGHINCDDIQESWDVISTDDPHTSGSKTKRSTGVDVFGAPVPVENELALYQNTPNPFNPVTTLTYSVPSAGRVTLRVFDVNGRLLNTVVDEHQSAGPHAATWNAVGDTGTRAASGIYFYQLTFEGSIVDTKKMLLLK